MLEIFRSTSEQKMLRTCFSNMGGSEILIARLLLALPHSRSSISKDMKMLKMLFVDEVMLVCDLIWFRRHNFHF